ncbi:hypothetical protein ACJIZ3_024823 [Penstemon smallii]|uniref:Uncharacterized protein n=1 Tax=Penstemon smallii TaxID=265156 RepID=A0ABD3TVI9_9LAMI
MGPPFAAGYPQRRYKIILGSPISPIDVHLLRYHSVISVTTLTNQFIPLNRLGFYILLHQISMWKDTFEGNTSPSMGVAYVQQLEKSLLKPAQLELELEKARQ